jgi:hypothetical protein
VANPIKMFLDTRARRINGETKHRMTVECRKPTRAMDERRVLF